MLKDAENLPYEPAALKGLVTSLASESKSRDILIEKLKHQLAGMRRHRFGSRSEALDQMALMVEDEEITASAQAPAPVDTNTDTVQPASGKNKPKRKPLPNHLPHDETTLSPGDTCGECGSDLRTLGEDVTEKLEYVPGRFVVNRIVRPRRTCTCCETFHQAALPSRPIEWGRPGPGLIAHVLVNKYADHSPLYRQSRIFERKGVNLERSTLADWVGKSTALLEPLAEAVARHVLKGQALFADDTPVKLLAPGSGKTKTARLWAYVRDERPWSGEGHPAAWYQFSLDRRGVRPREHLAAYEGFMHADGYPGFNELYRTGKVSEVACMAYIRRKFVDIHKAQGSAISEEAIKRIAKLYGVEKDVRGQPPDRRVKTRQRRSKPIFDDLEA
jgi:transposase